MEMWWEIELKMERGKGERGGKVGFMVQLAPRVVIYICNKPSWGTSQSGGSYITLWVETDLEDREGVQRISKWIQSGWKLELLS